MTDNENDKDNANAVTLLDYSGAFIQRRKLSEDDWKTISSQEGPFQLDLAYTYVTDDDLNRLAEKENLQFICLIECRMITNAGIEALCAKLPACKIEVTPKNNDHSWVRALSTVLFICGLAALLAWSVYEKPEKTDQDPNSSTQYYYLADESDPSLEKLASMPDLETLVLKEGSDVDEEGYHAMASLKHLKTLVLIGTKTTADELKILAQSKTIESLFLNGERLLGSGLVHLKAFPALKCVRIMAAGNISDDDLSALKDVPNLDTLSLSGAHKITDEGLKHIAACKSIRDLTLESCTTISNAGMEHLATMENLCSIGLERTQITDEGFAFLLKCPKLVNVTIGSLKITDDTLAVIGKLERLYSFTMTNCINVTDAGLLCIVKHKELTSLWLGACMRISADGLAPLKDNNAFVSIRIYSCATMADDLFDILPKSLQTCALGKSDDDHFSSRAIRSFKRSHPECKVELVNVYQQPL